MKSFGTEVRETYKKNKEAFNQFYFKKCICAAIIYRTVDNYLETNKESAKNHTGFWYKTGGYKLNIVPYSIAKIISSLPEGYSLDWDLIWNKQAVSAAFMHEIEIVTKMTNDFICESNGVIVTEYCKKLLTWETFRDKIEYVPSSAFLEELVSDADVKNDEHKATSNQKEDNNLHDIMEVIKRGADYWRFLVTVAKNNRISVSYEELTAIKQLMDMSEKGNVPITPSGKVPSRVMKTVKTALALENKLETEGLLKHNESDL
jgi:hypothetical protein